MMAYRRMFSSVKMHVVETLLSLSSCIKIVGPCVHEIVTADFFGRQEADDLVIAAVVPPHIAKEHVITVLAASFNIVRQNMLSDHIELIVHDPKLPKDILHINIYTRPPPARFSFSYLCMTQKGVSLNEMPRDFHYPNHTFAFSTIYSLTANKHFFISSHQPSEDEDDPENILQKAVRYIDKGWVMMANLDEVAFHQKKTPCMLSFLVGTRKHFLTGAGLPKRLCDNIASQRSCPLCLENFRKENTLVTTRCCHVFCMTCLNKSLAHHKVCPVCRCNNCLVKDLLVS